MEHLRHPTEASAEDTGPVIVRTYANPTEAFLARAALQQAGIECFLFDENMYNVEGIRGDVLPGNSLFGGLRLVVAPADAADAIALLSQSGHGRGAPLR